ncbi:putative Calcium-binding EF-hand family protein [Melia azedarach]|uniref:Calcium-binding EF-hand family protein n=1 Tax=Melia azedarach TaxID=155640 RepID=A0ACC1YF79_MELAZ|nr:putative Calcium-binding EF-hand family protein [Melia azedarach]
MPLSRFSSGPVTYTEEQLKMLFRRHDVNGDGKLGKRELKKVFEELSSPWPAWRASRALRHADSNGDGIISLDQDLDRLVKYVLRLGYKIK